MGSQPNYNFLKSVSDLENKFRKLTEQVAGFGNELGIRIIPYYDSNLPNYNRLDDAQKGYVLRSLEVFVKICQECLSAGGKLNESKTIVWHALKELGLRPSSDLFSYITNDHVIEVYNLDQIQIFRNFNFFQFVSYSVEDLFCKQWFNLFRRPEDRILKEIETVLHKILINPKKVLKTGIPVHTAEEVDSVFMFKMHVDIEYASTLAAADRTPVAYIVLEKAQLTHRPSKYEEQELLKKLYPNELTKDTQIIQLFGAPLQVC